MARAVGAMTYSPHVSFTSLSETGSAGNLGAARWGACTFGWRAAGEQVDQHRGERRCGVLHRARRRGVAAIPRRPVGPYLRGSRESEAAQRARRTSRRELRPIALIHASGARASTDPSARTLDTGSAPPGTRAHRRHAPGRRRPVEGGRNEARGHTDGQAERSEHGHGRRPSPAPASWRRRRSGRSRLAKKDGANTLTKQATASAPMRARAGTPKAGPIHVWPGASEFARNMACTRGTR